MDYNYFDNLINKHGFDKEPAFDNVLVEIAPLPPINGRPLGLYYPDPDHSLKVKSGTIWIPPDADEDTVLHELGHRYHHYYHNDLSENRAEEFRLSHRPAPRAPSRLEEEDHTGRNIVIGLGVLAGLALFSKLRLTTKS